LTITPYIISDANSTLKTSWINHLTRSTIVSLCQPHTQPSVT
jgi:hypothetical protein